MSRSVFDFCVFIRRWVFGVVVLLLPLVLEAQVFPFLYTHYANREPLASVLTDFANAGGYRAEITSAVEGSVSGRFDRIAPAEFLRSMERAFGVRWYRLGETIHFYHTSESRRVILSAPSLDAAQFEAQLEASGLVSSQLPLERPLDRSQKSAAFFAVSGPGSYVASLESLAAHIRQANERNVMRVFRLKYASADDLTIESMGRSVTVPGVATLLRAMILGEYTGAASGTAVKEEKAAVDTLRGTGLAARGKTPDATPEAATVSIGGVSIVADPRVNAVVVQDAQSRMSYYEQVIADLDKELDLIEIHAAIVDINSDFTQKLGVSFGVNREGNFSATGSSGSITAPDMISGSGNGGILSTIYTHGVSEFFAQIQALETNGNARVLGRPSIVTTDNLEATLENITTYYIAVTGNEASDLFKVEAGTVLRVTPHIIENTNGEASIKLAVTVQDNSQSNDLDDSMQAAGAIPSTKQTKINTQAIVDAGQSLLIGGYYFEQKSTGENGVPVLMHLPLLGRLFKTTTDNAKQMERLVLITPRILRLGNRDALPPQVSETDFSRTPTQDHYAPRVEP